VTRFDGISVRVTEFQHEPRRPKLLDLIQAMLKGDAPLPPIAQLIGFKLTSVTCGQAVIEFQAGEQHANPMGILHGGVFCDIADAAMGIAYASTLELRKAKLSQLWN
jgi:acyl-coenzyme A thioesterase PaaI-like protein